VVNSTSTGCRSTTNPAVEPYKLDPGKTTRPVEGDDRLKNVYEANAPIILENHQESSVSSSYNVPLTNDFTYLK
jgi:hypothetical protein